MFTCWDAVFLWFPEQKFVKQTFEKEKGRKEDFVLWFWYLRCVQSYVIISVFLCHRLYFVEWDDSLFCHINIKELSV